MRVRALGFLLACFTATPFLYHPVARLDATGVQQPVPATCSFRLVSSPGPQPIITGADAVTSRLVVISQPDSPIDLVQADLKGLELTVSDRSFNYSLTGPNQFDVRNLSDSVIEQIEVGLFVGSCGGRGGPPRRGSLWRGSLMPEKTITITTTGNGSGSGSFGQLPFIFPGGGSNGTVGGTIGGGVLPATPAGADAIHVFISIERVDIGACVYRPSQVLPRSLCGL